MTNQQLTTMTAKHIAAEFRHAAIAHMRAAEAGNGYDVVAGAAYVRKLRAAFEIAREAA